MPITESDLTRRYSVAAAAGNTTAGTAATSLGDQVSTTVIDEVNTLGNLFDDVSGAESTAGDTEYRCFFYVNSHATLTLTNATVQVLSQTPGGGNIDIATDNIGVTDLDAATPQAAVVANESTAPSGTSAFGAGPLSLGSIGPGQCAAVWVRRVVPSSASGVNPDGVVFRITGDTLP